MRFSELKFEKAGKCCVCGIALPVGLQVCEDCESEISFEATGLCADSWDSLRESLLNSIHIDWDLTDGIKHDQDKVRMHMLPWDAIYSVAEIMEHGAKKYTEDNWKTIKDPRRYESAMLRHYVDVQKGEDIDPDSGLLHWAHIACNALFRLHFAIEENNRKEKKEK